MTAGLERRRGSRKDIPAIRALVQIAYAKWIPLIGREPLPMSANYDQTIDLHRFDLFFRGADLVAILETKENDDHLLIENVCVAPDCQRAGLGKSLLRAAEDIAASKSYKVIRLDTNKLFSGNVELYQCSGYEIDWEKPIAHGVHVHMAKTLPTTGEKIKIVGHLDIPPDIFPAVKAALPAHIDLTRAEPGCLMFDVKICTTIAGRLLVEEIFVDKAAFDAHQKRAKGTAWHDITKGLSRHYTISKC